MDLDSLQFREPKSQARLLQLLHFFVLFVSLGFFSFLLIVYLQLYRSSINSYASSTPLTPLPVIPYEINSILGQPDDKETMVNKIVPNRGFHLGGVHVDNQNRIYVYDSSNNRILGFNNYVGPNQNADLVIGQTQLTDKGTANGDNTHYTQASDSTLASLPYPNVISTAESPRSAQMATDQDNNLFVIDANNNRVLKYISPFTTDTIADDVWGQPNMQSRTNYCGQAGLTPTASTLCLGDDGVEGQLNTINNPSAGPFTSGVDIDPQGNLWVTDSGNNRVLRFPNTGSVISKTADLVLGQPNFSSRTFPGGYTKTLSQMQMPVGVKVKPQTGEVYVLEGEWAGQARIMVFNQPFSNGMSASKEIGRAVFQDQQPSDTTNWENISGKWVHLTTGLFWPRGINFDPSGSGDVFSLDTGNHRTVLFAADGSIQDVIGQPNSDTRGCFGRPEQGYRQFDGSLANLCQTDGGIGIDTNGNIYISTISTVDGRDVARFTTPLTKDSTGHVISNGAMLHGGWNQFSSQTFQNTYGMSRSFGPNSQIYVSDGQRLLAWNNASSPATFAPADFIVGQDSATTNYNNNGGTFSAVTAGAQTVDPAGHLYVASNSRIFVFATPITSTAKNYAPEKILFTNSTNPVQKVVWADDGSPVTFDPSGVAFDKLTGALYVSDPGRQRILRIRDPLGAATVDLVIGQPNKTASSPNLGSPTPVRNGLYNPTYLSFDNFGNLYVVDASYELNGNRRLLRFNAAKLIPQANNIFPLPQADAVFSKSSFTSNTAEANQPGSPTAIGFDAANRMILTADGYGNKVDERVYFYNTPHLGEIIYPDGIVKIPAAQGSSIAFTDDGKLILQDHTWNRVIFATLQTPSATPTIPPLPTNTLTPIPTSTPTILPTTSPTPILSSTPTRTPTPSVELLINPGFETDTNNDGRPDSWTSSPRFTRNNLTVHDGSFSGMHFSSVNSGYSIDQTLNNIVAGANYTFSGWNNIPATSDSFTYRIQLIWKRSGGKTISTETLQSYTRATNGWENIVMTKTAPANAISVVVRMDMTSLKGPVFVDNFSLKR